MATHEVTQVISYLLNSCELKDAALAAKDKELAELRAQLSEKAPKKNG